MADDIYYPKFKEQKEATIHLARQCKLHPLLHSFIELNSQREKVLQHIGDDPQLYTGGTAAKFALDSEFDEAIDKIIESLKKCGCEE